MIWSRCRVAALCGWRSSGSIGVLLGMLAFATPVTAQTQSARIPDGQLQTYFNECVRTCAPTRGYAFCADTCGCMTHEIGARWDMARYRERTGRVMVDRNDPQVQAQMSRLASTCAARASTPLGGGAGSAIYGGPGVR